MARSRAFLVAIVSSLLLVSFSFKACGAPSDVREIKRLLWALDYEADRIDGVATAAMRERATKFLADHGKPATVSDDELLALLRQRFAEERAKASRPAEQPEILDRRGVEKTFSGDTKMVVSSDENLVLSGSCPIDRYQLSNSAPLRPVALNSCGSGTFVYSRPLGVLAINTRWSGDIYGLLIIDAASGLRTDFVEVPESLFYSTMNMHPNGREVAILTTKGMWKVDLVARTAAKLRSLPNNVVKGVSFSPDGQFYAAAWARVEGDRYPKELTVWDWKTQQRTFQSDATGIVFSEDGGKMALKRSTDTVEIREVQTGRLLASKKLEPSPEFRTGDKAVVFDKANESLLYLSEYGATSLREWRFGSGEDKVRFPLNSQADRAVISPAEGKLYTMERASVHSYDLQTGKTTHADTLRKFEPSGGALSPDRQQFAVYDDTTLIIVDLATGRVRFEQFGEARKIASVAFANTTGRVLIGTSQGALLEHDFATGRDRTIASLNTEIGFLRLNSAGTMAAVGTEKKLFVIDLQSGRVRAQTSCECGYGSHREPSRISFVDSDRRVLFADKWDAVTLDIASGARNRLQQLKSNVRTQGRRTTWMNAWIAYIVPKSAGSNSYWVGAKSFGSNILYEYADGRLSPVKGSPTGTFSFFPAGSEVADVAEDGALDVVLGYSPRTSRVSETSYASVHLPLRANAVALGALKGDRFVTLDKSGELRVYSRSQESPLVRTLLYSDGNWLSRTESGFFDGTKAATQNLYLALGPSNSVPLDNLFGALYRPDLVAAAISGDPQNKLKDASTKLDLFRLVDSGLPPVVKVLSPEGGAAATETVSVETSVTDAGGGIGRIEWRVNGVTIGVEEAKAARSGSGEKKAATFRREIALDAGDNKVEVVAYNAANLISSDPSNIVLTRPAALPDAKPRLFVLLVGVNDYWDNRLRLAYSVPDARSLASAFQQGGSELYSKVETRMLLDKEVTRDNLDKAFNDLGGLVRPSDVFVFYLAGHGKTVEGRYYFIPWDFKYQAADSIVLQGINQDHLQKWLARIPARKSVMLSDTCESGTLTEEKSTRGLELVAALETMTRAMGRTVLSATTDDQPAIEGYRGHGVFSYVLLDGFANADKDGVVDVMGLASYVDRNVPEVSFKAFQIRQIPQAKVVGSNFPLLSKVNVLPATDAPDIPKKPTHVVIAPAQVLQTPAQGAVAIIALPAGSQVTLVEAQNGWATVARNGAKLGYVEESKLLRMQ